MNSEAGTDVVADLRTAQNRMFPFVKQQLAALAENGRLSELAADETQVVKLYQRVKEQLLELLAIPADLRSSYHIGITDSGKRAIESLVSYFCPAEAGANVMVNSENYVAFNKFSAASAIQNQKGVEPAKPFGLEMGQALTRDADTEYRAAVEMITRNKVQTFWIAWNSTSTGVIEDVERLIAERNSSGSSTLMICDAASLPLFSNSWLERDGSNLPDVFFFSLRKQGIPYDGPQDEANQARNSGGLYVFNDRALARAKQIQGESIYDTPTPQQAADYQLTNGDQRNNHIRHLAKLECALERFLSDNRKLLTERDEVRNQAQQQIHQAFYNGGPLAAQGFSLLADTKVQSDSTYIIKVPESVKPTEVINRLKERGIHISLSMHPHLPGSRYCRFACYPANSVEETIVLLNGIADCITTVE